MLKSNNTDAEKIRIANEMLDAWSKLDFERALELFSEDAVLDSMTGNPMVGRNAIRERTKDIVNNLELMEMRVIRMGIIDDLVMMERLDKYILKGRPGTLPVAGVMKIVDGKVTEWREYFDRENWARDLEAIGLE